jgi:phosphoserine aminotransferase
VNKNNIKIRREIMNFILNLLSFLLIVFGLMFTVASSEKNQELIINKVDRSKLTQDQIDKAYRILTNIRFISFSALILGVGIIVARIFS